MIQFFMIDLKAQYQDQDRLNVLFVKQNSSKKCFMAIISL